MPLCPHKNKPIFCKQMCRNCYAKYNMEQRSVSPKDRNLKFVVENIPNFKDSDLLKDLRNRNLSTNYKSYKKSNVNDLLF